MSLSTFRGKRPRVAVILPAGGSGRRLGRSLPKQFLRIAGKPLLQRTLETFQRHRLVDEIVIVVPAEHERRTWDIVRQAKASKVSTIVEGGAHRQESVWYGLHGIAEPAGIVLVHDAVRPFVSPDVITRVIIAARQHGAAVVGVRVKDTIKVEEKRGYYARTLPRETLWGVQTPQGFRFNLLRDAHERARADGFVGTDEASLVERLGRAVRIVEGDEWNIKITTTHDLQMASFLARKRVRGH